MLNDLEYDNGNLMGNIELESWKAFFGSEDPIYVVIGSKMHPESQVEYPLLRKVLSTGYYWFMKLLFGMKLKDTQTGIKLFRTEKIRPVLKMVRTSRFSFDIEILAIAAKKGLSIIEMPVVVNFSRNKSDKSKISFSSIYEMVRDSLRIRMYVSKLKANAVSTEE